MKITKRTKTVLISISAPLLLVAAFVLVIAIYSNLHKPSEVDVLSTSFTTQQIEIHEGESIHFVNQSTSVTQYLCLGVDMHCDTFAFFSVQLPPEALQSPGVRLAPGQAKDVVFDTDGTFHITSTVVPKMNLTVTVDAGS